MNVQPSKDTSYFYQFHHAIQNTFSPLPVDSKIAEVAKRIFLVAIAPVAYAVLGAVSLVGALNPLQGRCNDMYKDVYFVRFMNIQTSNPDIGHISAAMNNDLQQLKDGKHRGACLYTPDGVQKLAVDQRGYKSIGVDFPFAVMIDPKAADLKYWSLTDVDTSLYGDTQREELKKKNDLKLKDHKLKHLFSPHAGNIKAIHYTPVEKAIEKQNKLAEAAKAGSKTYETRGGKQKDLAGVQGQHNESVITYEAKHIKGFLIPNDPKAIVLADDFRKNYVKDGSKIFEKVQLSYQDPATGKIIHLSEGDIQEARKKATGK